MAVWSRGARMSGSCYVYRQGIFVLAGVSFQEAVQQYKQSSHLFVVAGVDGGVNIHDVPSEARWEPMDA